MSHWRSFFDNKYLGNWDLPKDRDVVAVITKVEAGVLTSGGNRSDRKPIVFFRTLEKPLALNKTNAKAIAAIYGSDTSRWIGKPVALYVTMTSSPDGMVECVRVRPTAPKRTRGEAAKPQPAPEPTPGDDENMPEDPDAGP